MRTLPATACGVIALLLTASTASADVQLTIRGGRVTLVAKDATVRQILTEWARVGQTRIVNVERIPGGPVTLQFTDLPEADALDILLRSVAGYMAAPRPTVVSNLSRYDRIMVLPTASAPRTGPIAPPAPAFQPPPPMMQPDADDPAPAVAQPTRGPVFQAFPQPQIVNPQPATAPPLPEQATPPATYPGASALPGAPRPGMVVQPLTPPGQPPPTAP